MKNEIVDKFKTKISVYLSNVMMNTAFSFGNVRRLDINGKILEILIDKDQDHSNINQMAFDYGIVLTHFVARKKRLETEFLEITSKA